MGRPWNSDLGQYMNVISTDRGDWLWTHIESGDYIIAMDPESREYSFLSIDELERYVDDWEHNELVGDTK